MIHDAKIEVTCDGAHCRGSIRIEPSFVYPNYSGKGGYYDTSDDAIEKALESLGWICEDGKHYCDEGCKPNEE